MFCTDFRTAGKACTGHEWVDSTMVSIRSLVLAATNPLHFVQNDSIISGRLRFVMW